MKTILVTLGYLMMLVLMLVGSVFVLSGYIVYRWWRHYHPKAAPVREASVIHVIAYDGREL
jgi:hypothetical protein